VETIAELTNRFPRAGVLRWIGLRPARRAAMEVVDAARVSVDGGLEGDRGRGGKRAVTLLQAEHLPVIAALAGHATVDPGTLRRNLLVSGLNLAALRGRRVRIGTAELELTGPCAPCSRMEQALGPGGYNAVRGHGGATARVVRAGAFALGDAVTVVPEPEDGLDQPDGNGPGSSAPPSGRAASTSKSSASSPSRSPSRSR
jgi:MOSC domain-containing protein YiiM